MVKQIGRASCRERVERGVDAVLFQAEDGIRDGHVTGVQTCALPISNVSQTDLQYGKQLGYTMKLIGFASREQQNIEVSVQPTFLADAHPLAGVKNEYNAVYVNGEADRKSVV